jgi:fermentation-respiration switch protein FrsA (DUF1100 family)
LGIRRLGMIFVIAFAAVLVLAAVLVRVFENRLIYFPPPLAQGLESPAEYGLQLEEVWLIAEDGVKLNAWFLSAASSSKALLVFHGNAENLGLGLPRLKALSKLGANILAIDYRGYGKSQGSPNEAGIYRDAEAAYRYLVEARRIATRNIFIYGQSLGSAVAIDLASRRECGGLIVESGFTSGREMARRMFRIPFFEYLPKSRFDSLAKISRVRCPVLVIHGTEDDVLPASMGERLYAAAPQPKSLLLVEGARHNNVFWLGGERYLQRLVRFVNGSV